MTTLKSLESKEQQLYFFQQYPWCRKEEPRFTFQQKVSKSFSNSKSVAIGRNHFDDQQGEDNSNTTARNLPKEPPIRSLEESLKLIDNYEHHEVPSIPGLNGIIGKCNKHFEMQLTESDLRDDQSKLSINKAGAQK
uniref:Uncharacterized protein n=1 Tax=Salix viminalis TaxID=40686 RepID=A0A6N2L0Z2_SALVM